MGTSCKAAVLLSIVLLALMMTNTVYAAPRGTSCGANRYVNGGAGDNMDSKVNECPSGQSWEACCAACGSRLAAVGTLTRGWYCENGGAMGIWLKGCKRANTCNI